MTAAHVQVDQGATLRLVLYYAIFACLWILLSDQAVIWIFSDPVQIAWVSSIKGWLFVAVTSVLLYGLIQRYLRKIQHSLQLEAMARAEGAYSHELLSAIVEGTEDAVFAKDLQGRYMLVNQATCRFVDKSQQQILGLDDKAIFPPEQAEMLMELDRRVVANKRVRTTEESLSTPQGERVFLATKGPLCNAQGEVIGSYGVSREITAHKRMLERLGASEERLRLALEATHDGVWDWDVRRDVAYRSPRYFEIIGRKESECAPDFSLFKSIIHSDDKSLVLAAIDANRAGRTAAVEVDFRLAGSTQPTRWLRARGRVVQRDAQGEAVRMVGTLSDISVHKQAEEHLRQLNQDLESKVAERSHELLDLYDHAPCGYHSLASDGTVLRVNQTELALLGYAREDYVGHAIERFMTPESRALYQARVAAFPGSGHLGDLELDFVCKNGQILPLLLSADLVRDPQGQAQVTRSTVIDNSERKAAEQSLLAARHVAEAATLAKSEFLANMSHEIRTPMNGILGLAYLLEQAHLPAEAARLVRKIGHTGRSLQGILNDILDFSKIEAGHLEPEQARFELGDVLESVATIMVNGPDQPEIELAIAPPPGALGALLGDPLRIGQILSNLVGNAIKFTQSGHVQLAVSESQRSDAAVTLQFSVSDTGIGISALALEEIFKPFSQADASTTRRYGGTGLGLTISRRLVEMMGGTLQVKSLEGQGSEFSFALNLPWAAREPTSVPQRQALEVLIADDNAISRNALRATTLGLGWKASVVDGGQAALQHVLARQQQHGAPQVLVLDWHMPDLDGLAVARAVNHSLRGSQGPILILATAHSRDELLAQAGSPLIDAVLSKPVTPTSLRDAVQAALDKRAGGTEKPLAVGRQRLTGVRLLVVDDSEINLEIARLIFAAEGAEVVTADNGQLALDWLQAHPLGVDLVLMDVQMPVMDGVRATQMLRAIPALAQLPVVALTAGAFKTKLDATLAAGMNEHLTKPMDVERAVAVILKLTGRSSGELPRAPAQGAAPAPARPDSLAPLNLRRGLEIWRGPPLYQQYLRKFARDYEGFARDMATMAPPARQAWAHKLRGAAGNLALDQVAAAAAALEERLSLQQDPAAGLQAVQEAIDRAQRAIAEYAPAEPPAPLSGPVDRQLLGRLLAQALQILAQDTSMGLEAVLQALEAALPASQVTTLRQAVERFDFRSAEAAVRALAQTLQVPADPGP